MARRRESILEALVFLPWWVGVLLGIVGYAAVTLILPMLWRDQILGAVAEGTRPIATFWLVMCLLAAAGSAIRSFFIRRKFDQQTSIEDVRNLSWQQFETIVGEAFRRLGYRVMENGGGGADGGVDLVLDREGQRFFVQCKQWKVPKVGVKPIRELAGVMSAKGVRDGFFVTSGTYTKEARQFADETGIALVDGSTLERMVRDVQSSVAQGSTVEKAVSNPSTTCPACGGSMIKRTAKRGANAGSQFFGCMSYPKCRGTRAFADGG